jgi:plastocyanin
MTSFLLARRIAPLAFAVALACGTDPKARPDEDGDDPTPTLAATVTVSNNAFSPATVTLLRTGTVTWNWTGGPHNVTFSDANSGNKSSGETFARTFNNTGSFSYTCTLHPTIMTGTVVVQ